MRPDPSLNGCDYLMLGFDHELRRRGFAANACQIILDLAGSISAGALKARLAELAKQYPVLNASPGGVLTPKWKLPRHEPPPPEVRVHRDEPGLCQQLFNEPLAVNRGELLRFDLIERGAGRMSLILTWAHALMDAPAAEHFLAMVGDREMNLPAASPSANPSAPPIRDRLKLGWKYLHHLDELCKAPPRCITTRYPAAAPALSYRLEKFSVAETERVRANCARLSGVLGDAQYHAAVSIFELDRLHKRVGSSSPSYVLPMPVGLRRKGTIDPLFSNQVSMLIFQFLPEHLGSVADAVAALKAQTAQAMRTGLLDSGRTLSEMFRFLPLPIYVALLKHGLRGEFCSLFYGDTGAVHPKLTSFFGVPVEEFTHVAAVTPSPGLGVIFYYFRQALRVTVLYSAQVLNEAEAAEFGAGMRERLLNP